MTAPTEFIRFGGGLPDPALVPPLADLFDEVVRDPAALTYGGDDRELGYEPLRAAVAERLDARAGTTLGADNVVIANGSAGALELVAKHFVQPGTVVAVEEMSYPAAVSIFRQQGAAIVPVPLDDEGVRVDSLAELLDDEGRRPSLLYAIATGQSPTGTTLSPERRKELARLASSSGLVVVQDDTYGELYFEPVQPDPIIGLAPDHTVHVGSFSKTLAPGLRLGWLATTEETCRAIAATRTDLGTTPIVQHAVSELFARGRFEPHLVEVTAVYRAKRDALVGALEQHCRAFGSWTAPQGGLFLWLVLNDGDVGDLEHAAAEEGVGFLGGPYFTVEVPNRGGLRLAYGELSIEQIEEGVRRLARAMERVAG